ncbi:unnamed protein product [Medioppia subpectinata]|uniref:Protein kinase domain-containing protein n=1 Tax=Medioppia subpectinata TaxID=1979941 RepID=A0A7R9L0L7_9ACAR|nr:unnamed protein product [Medioppia subpectinata]CAG2113014.1 unnamed protein product [Medioppia subpectinata]
MAYFNDKNIVQLSCGAYHALALNGDGRVYAWGADITACGQFKFKPKYICTPIEIKLANNYKIQCIHAYGTSSFAITSDGHVFSWGYNGLHQLGHRFHIGNDIIDTPRLVDTIDGVKAITSMGYSTQFHATNGIYVQLISTEFKLIDTKYDNFVDFYANEYQITYNTIDLKQINDMNKIETMLTSVDIKSENKSENNSEIKSENNSEKSRKKKKKRKNKNKIEDKNDNICENSSDNNYNNQFIEMSAIGSGGFGTVFKVKHGLDDKMYAVKRLQFKDISEETKQSVVEEMNSLTKLDSDFVVKYYNSWLESNHLFIQMQFYSQSLRTVLKDKPIVFGRQPEDQMNVFEYFTSCEIFKELLECVEYLHESDPPVIHRNLKPENILIDPNFTSNRCVKVCDFGLVTDHNTDRQIVSPFVHSVCGTFGYIAPEVLMGKQYDHKSDIYSLSIIGEELFGIDLQDWKLNEAKKLSFKKCIQSIYGTLLDMMSTPFWRQRPECREVLAKYNEWSIDKTFVTKQNNFHEVLNTLKSNNNSGFYEILFRKTQ